MSNILKLDYDKWVQASASELLAGDYVMASGRCFILAEPPVITEGGKRIELRPVMESEMPPIKVMLGQNDGLEYAVRVMDYVLASLMTFGDGTAMIADFECSSNIYTPRMSEEKLEEFCRANLQRYVDFYEQNESDIENGKHVDFKPFW